MSTLLGASTLYLNLAGEMMYIIDQRQSAQNVGPLKSSQVLCDIATALLNPNFEKELFPSKVRPLPNMTTVRAVMERLVHTSIMKLNQHSMDKQFDLMIMGLKRQLLVARHPVEILQCTLNHLDSIARLTGVNLTLSRQVLAVKEHYTVLYRKHSYQAVLRVKSVLLNHMEEQRVKISVQQSHGLQFSNASMVPRHDGVLPPGSQVPGLIRYFAESRLSCNCLTRSVVGLGRKVTKQSTVGACTGSPSSSSSTASSGSRLVGETVQSARVLKVSAGNQYQRIVTIATDRDDYITLPHSGVCFGPPLSANLVHSERECKLGNNIYVLPIPSLQNVSGIDSNESKDDQEDDDDHYDQDNEEQLAQEIADTLQNLPMANIDIENPFYLNNLFDSHQDEEEYRAKESLRAARVKKSINERANLLLGDMNTPTQPDEDEDLDL